MRQVHLRWINILMNTKLTMNPISKASETEPEIVPAELKAEATVEATQEAAASVDTDEPTEPKAVVPEEELTKQDSEQAISKPGEREAIRRFAKPETGEEASETPIVGPKAPPQNIPKFFQKVNVRKKLKWMKRRFSSKKKMKHRTFSRQLNQKKQNRLLISNQKKKTPATKNYKKLSIILAAVVVLAGGSWAVYNQLQKEPGTQAVDKQEDVQKLQKELNSYFTDKAQTFIKPEMVDVAHKSIKTAIASIKNEDERKKLEDTYNKVVEKQAAISKTNELFTQPIINGDKLNTSLLKADQKVTVAKREEKDDFDKLLNQGRAEALAQYDQLQKAKAAVAGFYQNNEFTAALTRETYNAAKTEVDLVKNEALRKPLNEILAKADKVLSDAEAAAAEADQSVQTPTQTDPTYQADQTQQQTTGQQVDANGFSAPNADGVYTAPGVSGKSSRRS
jgi:hypothetical protein